jgi:NAD-dependent SIR2 family protein deacetylase
MAAGRVVAPRGLVLRAAADKESKRVGTAKKGEELEVRQLVRTASGTMRAETARGWTTALSAAGIELLAVPEGVPEGVPGAGAAAGPALPPAPAPAPQPELEPELELELEPEPKPAANAQPTPAARAEVRAKLAATAFLRHEDPLFMHGRAYNGPLTPPRVTWRCAKPPRDDHDAPKWLTASEYHDQPEVAQQKVRQLAAMMRASTKTVIYSGAGISASVIGQAARSGQNKQGWEGGRHQAKPTFTHQALAHLVHQGLVHGWVQQNHDGLPQKAGVAQEKINEIHGSWYDPANPVVKYHGDLHDRFEPWMVDDSETADLVLVLGTSLGGLYADQVATDTAERSRAAGVDAALGSVMINLQQTTEDGKMSLRLFGTSDDMLALLMDELGYGAKPNFPAPVFRSENRLLVPYDKNGRLVPGAADGRAPKMWLDLSPGANVRITPGHNIQGAKQPAFLHIGGKKARKFKGETREPGPGRGTVTARDDAAYCYRLRIEGAEMRLGLWWLDAAARGAVDAIPIVNAKPEMEQQ